MAKNDRIHYLRLLGADTSKYEKNKFAEQRNIDAKNSAEKESAQEDTSVDTISENGKLTSQAEAENCDNGENQ